VTPEEIRLAKHLVTLPAFRWKRGMLATNGARFIGYEKRGIKGHGSEMGWCDPVEEGGELHWVWPIHIKDWLPDITDPATLGCLLHLVKEKWGETAHLVRHRTNDLSGPVVWWALATGGTSNALFFKEDEEGHGSFVAAPTEPAALIAALECEA